MGNYPFVSSHVLQRSAGASATRDQALLRLETISSEPDLARLDGSWDALVLAMRRPSPFLLHCWLLEWWRHYGDGCRLVVPVAFRGSELVGALPLISYPRRGLRLLTFVGGRQSALADALIAEGEGPDLVEALVDRAGASEHDFAALFGLCPEGRLAKLRGPRALRLFQRIEAPVLDVDEGWNVAYRRKTNSRKRSHHRRRRRQLAELGEVEVSVARTRAELEPALDDAFRIHELRWRDRPDGSGFVTATGRRFNQAVVGALADLDATRIVTLKIDGRPIAFCWYFLLAGRAYLHRLTFDPAFSRCSPGLVNALDTLELAAAEGVERVEFLGGAERYKVELADRFEPLYLGLGLPGSGLGRSVVAARAGGLRLRERAKRSELAGKVYYGTASVRSGLRRRRDALRPSGLQHSGD